MSRRDIDSKTRSPWRGSVTRAALLAERRKPYFIAVGALHLAGPKGLVEILRKRGYVVRQL